MTNETTPEAIARAWDPIGWDWYDRNKDSENAATQRDAEDFPGRSDQASNGSYGGFATHMSNPETTAQHTHAWKPYHAGGRGWRICKWCALAQSPQEREDALRARSSGPVPYRLATKQENDAARQELKRMSDAARASAERAMVGRRPRFGFRPRSSMDEHPISNRDDAGSSPAGDAPATGAV